MDKLLDFVDRLCIDERLYWRVSRLDCDDQVEVSWEREARPKPWKVRRVGEADWTTVVAGELEQALTLLAADQTAFERQLGASILTQAVFADMVLEGAVRLFGDDVVKQSIRDTRAFLSSVSDAAHQMTRAAASSGSRSKLRLISRGGS